MRISKFEKKKLRTLHTQRDRITLYSPSVTYCSMVDVWSWVKKNGMVLGKIWFVEKGVVIEAPALAQWSARE